MDALRARFDTVRQLEKQTYSIFAYGGGGLLAGLVMLFIFAPIGLFMMIVSGLLIFGGMAWVTMLGKEPARQVFCPYCSNRNDVYESRSRFDCDVCGRAVLLSDSGEPIATHSFDPNPE